MGPTQTVTEIRLVWTIDCEATQQAVNDPDLGERATRGFCELIASTRLKATLFVLPTDTRRHARIYRDLAAEGFEVGLHYHPQEAGHADHCGAHSADDQRAMYTRAISEFADALGFAPTTFRSGSFSANDATFPVTRELGFSSCSHSCPGRNMVALRSNWAGAPHHVHFAHAANRLLEGDLDLVEVPLTTDPDSMLWSGAHPQDLRVELFDAKNQRYMINKMVRRERQREHPVPTVVTLTHNVFDYADPRNFRRETMIGMITAFSEAAASHNVRLVPSTIGDIADAYRKAHAAVNAKNAKNAGNAVNAGKSAASKGRQ